MARKPANPRRTEDERGGQGHRILGQRIEFPDTLSRKTTATGAEIEHLVATLATVFGIVHLPTTTMYGVWKGKDGLDWQYERVKIDPRSQALAELVERDLSIVESSEGTGA